MSRRLNAEDHARIAGMRSAGCLVREIADKVGCSERTVKRSLARTDTQKGEIAERVKEEIVQGVVRDLGSQDEVLGLIDGLLNELILHAREARSRLREAADGIEVKDLQDYQRLARAEASSATVIKVHLDAMRSLLNFRDGMQPESELPVLEIYRLTDEDVRQMREDQENEARELGLE